MKTYILDTFNRYKRFSKELDVKTALCNRSWVVFNDCGEREVYKFREDGELKIVLSGRVSEGQWEYDPVDDTIEIRASNQAFMVHPGMYDNLIMALKIDGTDEVSFLIDTTNEYNFEPKSLNELMLYFEAKEQALIEKAKRNESEREINEQQQRQVNIVENFCNFCSMNGYYPIWNFKKNALRILTILVWLIIFGMLVSVTLILMSEDTGDIIKSLVGIYIPIVVLTLMVYYTFLMQNSKHTTVYDKYLSEFKSTLDENIDFDEKTLKMMRKETLLKIPPRFPKHFVCNLLLFRYWEIGFDIY